MNMKGTQKLREVRKVNDTRLESKNNHGFRSYNYKVN